MADINKTRYVLMKEVAELAIAQGGTVFGGFVRDFVIHEDGAKRFYSDDKNTLEEYSNSSVSPETFEDRTLVPKDIDVRFKCVNAFNAFKKELRDRSYRIMRTRRNAYTCWTIDVSLQVILQAAPCSVAHSVLKNHLKSVSSSVPGGDFSIDVVLGDVEDTGLDFECNGLIMDGEGVRLGAHLSSGLTPIGKFRILQNVLEDIKNKRAYATSPKAHRWKKMDSRSGWNIMGETTIVNKMCDAKDDCLICHGGDACYKLTCCNAFYHFECLSRAVTHNSNTCAHCRRNMFFSEEETKLFDIDA